MRHTLASLVDDWRRRSSETAVVAHRGNRRLRTSYGGLAQLAGRFAAELQRHEIAAGERVLLWGENSAEWIAAFFGCMLQGVLVVPLDATGGKSFAQRVLEEVSPKLVVGDRELLQQLGPEARPRLFLSELPHALPPQPNFAVAAAVSEESPFQIVFTSGTTSEPKGIVHTHRNVLASLRPIEAEIERYRRYERWFHPLRFLHTLPFSHVFGQFMGLWIPGVLGAELHLPDSVSAPNLVRIVHRERVSVLVAVPRVLEMLRAHLLARFPQLGGVLTSRTGLSALKRWWVFREVHRAFGLKFWALICGGATLPAELESFWNGLGFALVQGYGMTETAALVTLNHPFKVGRGTLGQPLPGREVRLRADGEMEVRGDMLAAGTWQGGVFQPRAQEWLATGDLATRDANGALRFAGRRGDVIVTAAGLNIHPQDLESVLLVQAGVRACAVVGCEGSNGSEPVGVVLFDGDEQALRQAVEQANAKLAPHQQLRHVYRWPEAVFPYTATGKLLRRKLAQWVCAQRSGAAAAVPPGGTDPLLQAITGITHERVENATDTSRLTEDLHLDSLGRVQLQALLEQQFGVALAEDRWMAASTLGELRQLTGLQRTSPGAAAMQDVSVLPAPQGKLASILRSLPYARWPWSGAVRWARALFLNGVAVPLVRVLARPRIVGSTAIATQTPMLLIANHVNTYDLPLLLSALPPSRRAQVATAMSAEVLADLRYGRNQGHWLLNLLARPAYWLITALFNVFPLPRLRGFRESFAHAGEALDGGGCVLIFPEGRRGWTGEMQPFRPGIGLLVQSSRVPVLPLALTGAGSQQRGGARWFRPSGLSIRVGEPLHFAPGQSAEEITRALEIAMRGLLTTP